jgi:hypothetical protein
MNDFEQFEKRLQRQPLRQAPPAWREEIVSAARQAETPRHSSRVTFQSLLTALNSRLSALLWPHPRAWAGLAAVWVMICLLNFAYREDAPPASARRAVPPSPQMREMLRAQEQLLAELVEEMPLVNRPKTAPPRPHSFYRNEFLNA